MSYSTTRWTWWEIIRKENVESDAQDLISRLYQYVWEWLKLVLILIPWLWVCTTQGKTYEGITDSRRSLRNWEGKGSRYKSLGNDLCVSLAACGYGGRQNIDLEENMLYFIWRTCTTEWLHWHYALVAWFHRNLQWRYQESQVVDDTTRHGGPVRMELRVNALCIVYHYTNILLHPR